MGVRVAKECGICLEKFCLENPFIEHSGPFGKRHRLHRSCVRQYHLSQGNATCIYKCGAHFNLKDFTSWTERAKMGFKKFKMNAIFAGSVSALSGALIPLFPDPNASLQALYILFPAAVLLAGKSGQLIHFEFEWCLVGVAMAPLITWACTSTIPGAMLVNGAIAGLFAGTLSKYKPNRPRVV